MINNTIIVKFYVILVDGRIVEEQSEVNLTLQGLFTEQMQLQFMAGRVKAAWSSYPHSADIVGKTEMRVYQQVSKVIGAASIKSANDIISKDQLN